jgi:hypothetical protein
MTHKKSWPQLRVRSPHVGNSGRSDYRVAGLRRLARALLSNSRAGHACAAVADPKVPGDLVEADWVRTQYQVPIEPGSDGRYAPRSEQARPPEALLTLARRLV